MDRPAGGGRAASEGVARPAGGTPLERAEASGGLPLLGPTLPAQDATEVAGALRQAGVRVVVLGAVLIAAGLLFRELVTLVVAIVIAVIVAIALSAVAGPLQRRGVPRPLGALAGVLVVVGGAVGLLAVVVPPLVGEFDRFAERFPDAVEDLGARLAGITGADPDTAGRRMREGLERAAEQPAELLGPVAAIGLGVAGVLSAAVLILITAYYMAARPGPLVDGLLRLFPPPRREWAAGVLERIRDAWSGWLRGVVIDMVVTGVLLYAGLLAIGLDFAVLFAVLSALLVVVPYFGAILGGIPPVLLALTESPELALGTLLVYVVVQQIEGNVIVPLVMARAVKLPPALIAIGVVIVSQLFGVVGLFVAVPLLSASVILVDELWVRPQERKRNVALPATPRGPLRLPDGTPAASDPPDAW